MLNGEASRLVGQPVSVASYTDIRDGFAADEFEAWLRFFRNHYQRLKVQAS